MSLDFLKLSLLHFMQIILVPFRLLLTRHFISALSTLKWLVILFMKHMMLVLSLSRISLLLFRLSMCSLRLFPSIDITFLLTNWYFLIIQHQFKGGYQWKKIIDQNYWNYSCNSKIYFIVISLLSYIYVFTYIRILVISVLVAHIFLPKIDCTTTLI